MARPLSEPDTARRLTRTGSRTRNLERRNTGTGAAATGMVDWDATIIKSVTESVASAVSQNDDELFFAVTSGRIYRYEGFFIYDSPAGGGTPDIRIFGGEDGTTRGSHFWFGIGTADTVLNSNGRSDNVNTSQPTFGTATTLRAINMRGWHLGNGGTWHLIWAQATSNANPTRVLAGSWLRYADVTAGIGTPGAGGPDKVGIDFNQTNDHNALGAIANFLEITTAVVGPDAGDIALSSNQLTYQNQANDAAVNILEDGSAQLFSDGGSDITISHADQTGNTVIDGEQMHLVCFNQQLFLCSVGATGSTGDTSVPSSDPNVYGQVWVDSNGFLRMSDG